MNGRKAAGLDAWPVYVPVKTTSFVVVTPGLTGLPSSPEKLMSTARFVRRASTPPTMLPLGHFQRAWLCHERDAAHLSGARGSRNQTQGPATGMQT